MAELRARHAAKPSTAIRSVDPTIPSVKPSEIETLDKGEIWWINAIFFVALHIFAVVGAVYLSPITQLDVRTALLCFISWQLASFGVTIGYHRLWSHRAFTATTPLRVCLAWMGCLGFQGSIKWWVLRHRLHHRFTDSKVHDPYAATNGLFYAHCGWIFRKRNYPRMQLIERADLEADPVVVFQHKYYVPMAFFSGYFLPVLLAHFGWKDALGGAVWGGAVARLLIWHTTFCINSLAHWTGLQPYTEEVTARGNYVLALLTSGEGNHNFHHAFPKDFRNGPHSADWDPSKWIIFLLHKYTPFVPSIARTPDSAVRSAQARVHMAEAHRLTSGIPSDEKIRPKEELPVWSKREVAKRNGEVVVAADGSKRRRVLLLLEGCLVDVGGYIDEHPGGAFLLTSHVVSPIPHLHTASVPVDSDQTHAHSTNGTFPKIPLSTPARTLLQLPANDSPGTATTSTSASPSTSPSVSASASDMSSASSATSDSESDHEASSDTPVVLKDATRAFFGGMNNHSGAAKERMRCFRVARLSDE